MKTLLLACLLLCALGWSRVYAQDADALLAQSKQAAGGDAWNGIRSLSVTSEGLQGEVPMVEEQHWDVQRGRYLTTYRVGSFDAPGRAENAEGYDGKTAWEMDASGYSHPIMDAGSLRRVINETYLASFAYWFPGRAPARREYIGHKQDGGKDFDVIRITPEGGQPFELWIDGKTHLVDRFIEQEPTEVVTTYLSDYSQAGDVKFPFTTRYAHARPGFDSTRKVRQVETSTADTKIFFGVPSPPPPDYRLPANQESVTIPFQFSGNHILVAIRINGRGPFTAVFDTGGYYLMSPAIAAELSVTSLGASRVGGFGENSVKAGTTEAKSVQIGGVTLLHPTFAVIDLGEIPVSTIIGYEVLRRFVVRIDYDRHLLILTHPDKFVYHGNGVALPLRLHGNTPAVEGEVDGIKGLFSLDTGSGGSLDLFGPFIQAHDLRHKYMAGFTAATGIGVGGISRAQSVHVGTLALGAAEVRNAETGLTADQGGEASDADLAGNVGGTVLRRFNLIFDYAHGQVILEKNKGYGRAEDGHAGLAMLPHGREWRVISVTPGGAAAQAGVRQGDRVLKIDGKDARQLSLLASWDVTHHPVGTKVWLLLQDGSQKRLVAITLGKVP